MALGGRIPPLGSERVGVWEVGRVSVQTVCLRADDGAPPQSSARRGWRRQQAPRAGTTPAPSRSSVYWFFSAFSSIRNGSPKLSSPMTSVAMKRYHLELSAVPRRCISACMPLMASDTILFPPPRGTFAGVHPQTWGWIAAGGSAVAA